MISTALKDYLVAEGVGTFGTDLYVSKFPDTPDNALCIYEEAGAVLPEMSSYDANNFGSHIMVRGSFSYVDNILTQLLRKIPMWSGEYDDKRIIDSRIETFPQFIEVDDKGRRVYSIHFSHYTNIGNNKYRTGNYTP